MAPVCFEYNGLGLDEQHQTLGITCLQYST